MAKYPACPSEETVKRFSLKDYMAFGEAFPLRGLRYFGTRDGRLWDNYTSRWMRPVRRPSRDNWYFKIEVPGRKYTTSVSIASLLKEGGFEPFVPRFHPDTNLRLKERM